MTNRGTQFRFSETKRGSATPHSTYILKAGEFIDFVKSKDHNGNLSEFKMTETDFCDQMEDAFYLRPIEEQLQMCVAREEDRIGVSIEYEEVI